MRTVLAVLVALLLGIGGATAGSHFLGEDFYVEDSSGKSVDFTFTQIEADTVEIQTITGDSVLALTAKFALTKPTIWFNADFEQETHALNAWIRFKTPDGGSFGALTIEGYTWQDWIPIALNGNPQLRSINVCAPESVHVKVFGGADGLVQLGWWTEARE